MNLFWLSFFWPATETNRPDFSLEEAKVLKSSFHSIYRAASVPKNQYHQSDNTVKRLIGTLKRRQNYQMAHASHRPVASGSNTYLVFVSNLHRETSEENVRELFDSFGIVKSIDFVVDKLSGYCKGYCLVEYVTMEEADHAVKSAHMKKILGTVIHADHTFIAEK